MGTLTTGSLLTDQFIKALSNTLMHSLWQGVLLAVAGGFIIIFTKKLSAALRYNLLLGAMVLFTCGVIFTFLWQLQPVQTGHLIYKDGNAAINSPAIMQAPQVAANYIDKQNVADTVIGYLNAHCNTIVLIWFLIICAKSIKLAVGIHEIYHLKHTKTYAVSKYWETRLAYLSYQLKIKQAISLVESGIAKVPMVIGHLKPLILIPIGFINALSADEVEAILVHELAHIGRRDYLVNLLQSFLEIIFFFNPAVLWISQLIKAERENCCDDIALKQAGSKSGYIQALLSCQEYQLAAPGLSMALARDKSKLLNRVKRMVNNHNQSLNIMEKTLLTICMVTGGLLTVAFSTKDTIRKPAAKIRQVQQQPISVNPQVVAKVKVNTKVNLGKIDTTLNTHGKIYNPSDFEDGTTMRTIISKNGKPQKAYLFKRSGVLYQLDMDHNNKVETLYVNAIQRPVSQYQTKINELLKEYKEVAAVAPVPPVPPVGLQGVKAPVTPAPNAIAMVAPPAAPLPPAGLQGVKVPVPATPIVAPPARPMPPAGLQGVKAPVPAMPAPNAIAMVPPSAALTAPVSPAPKIAAMVTPAAPVPPAPLTRVNGLPSVAPMAPIPPIKPDGRFKEAADRLIERGIIKDKNDFDMSLSNKSLKVDGALQPEDIHQEILKIFAKKPGDKVNWHYSKHESSESTSETTKK
ncbi:M56 family metallopeptidase [Mucilaginibacter sp. OK098]|uniref:M56 family metallopeptidase n=1 Tax=Mucilaginibacter sp. OK098 TaxID=1855297 RepID=UPI00091DF465|nr:M56 family metallopeptidase [Mucilaginibacter sp. OK098]SHM74287.1 Signal transducer regulating beta-lactamase production, contains metallopeptidase domain [Mucilaginibacter sp. OK098]